MKQFFFNSVFILLTCVSMAQCPTTVSLAPVYIPCGSNYTIINAGTTSQPPNYTYSWTPPSVTAGMSCQSCYTTTTNQVGTYTCSITNTIGGCTVTNTVQVLYGSITASFVPSYTTGCNPLAVSFTNTSTLGSANTGTVTTTWNYGNGSITTVTNVSSGGSPNGSTTYTSTGTYTVSLFIQQAGPTYTCTDTHTATINVTCVGIEEYEATSGITIFPQPSGGRFTISIENEMQGATLEIVNSFGQKVHSSTVSQGSNPVECDLPQGIYHITIFGKDRILKWAKLLVE